MAINKVTKDTPIHRDNWVCETPMLRDGLCSQPRKVVRVSGQRIYLAAKTGEDRGDYIARTSALYVCDTKAEGDAVHAISNDQRAALDAVRADHKAKVAALIAGTGA
jgi:hypothetical protein